MHRYCWTFWLILTNEWILSFLLDYWISVSVYTARVPTCNHSHKNVVQRIFLGFKLQEQWFITKEFGFFSGEAVVCYVASSSSHRVLSHLQLCWNKHESETVVFAVFMFPFSSLENSAHFHWLTLPPYLSPSSTCNSILLLNPAHLKLEVCVPWYEKEPIFKSKRLKQIGPLLKLIWVIISWIWQANHGLFSHTRQREREEERRAQQTIIHLQHIDVWKWHCNYSIQDWRMAPLILRFVLHTILTTFKMK